MCLLILYEKWEIFVGRKNITTVFRKFNLVGIAFLPKKKIYIFKDGKSVKTVFKTWGKGDIL